MKAFSKHTISVCLMAISVSNTLAQCIKKYDPALHRIIYTKADVMPEFPGGVDGWRRYLERHLTIPDSSFDECLDQWSLKSHFIVETDGSLSHIVINNQGDSSKLCGTQKSFFDLLKTCIKWKTGKCGNVPVPVRYEQNIACILPAQ